MGIKLIVNCEKEAWIVIPNSISSSTFDETGLNLALSNKSQKNLKENNLKHFFILTKMLKSDSLQRMNKNMVKIVVLSNF